jgi:4-carboxymuconolactone decarboxylase
MSSKPGTALYGQQRIPMADAGKLSDAQSVVYEKIVSGKRGKLVGPLRVVLHSPELADRWQALGEYLRFETALPTHIAELAIIMTGRYWNCQVEWVIHSAIAEEAGLTPDVIDAIRDARPPKFDDSLQSEIYEYTRELLEFGHVSDEVYRNLLELIGVAKLVELTAVVGYYSMVAMTLNAHDVPLPEDEKSLPLDLPQSGDMLKPTRLPPAHPGIDGNDSASP